MKTAHFIETPRGSPAHAGIDRGTEQLYNCDIWFPRTRGDRPLPVRGLAGKAEVPPHTRG